MRMNADFSLQLLLLLPVSFVSAAAVSYFVPRAGAVDNAVVAEHMETDISHGQFERGTDFYHERIVQAQWEKYRRWALVSKHRKKSLLRARLAKLAFVSTGAVMQVASTQVPVAKKATYSCVGGALVAIGAYIKTKLLTEEKNGRMVTSYYVSQSIKSEVIKFRAKTGVYSKTNAGSKDKALELLRKRCSVLSSNGDDKLFHMMKMDKKEVPKPMETKSEYVDRRLDFMINDHYVTKAKSMERRGKICSSIEDLLLGAGTLAGFAATQNLPGVITKFTDVLTGYAGALTTVAAAFANHHAKMKYEEVTEQYYDAAEALSDLKDTWPLNCHKAGDPGWDEHVLKCEIVIVSTVEEYAKARTGNDDLTFVKPKRSAPKETFAEKVWNPDAICSNDETLSSPANERAARLMENESLTKEDAIKRIMEEFPESF